MKNKTQPNEQIVNFTKARSDAFIPEYGSGHAAGADLRACLSETIFIQPYGRALIPTGLRMALLENFYGRIAPRSGIAYRKGIDVLAGVIDNDYEGEVGVILQNLDDGVFKVKHGDRIAQIIIERCYRAVWNICDEETWYRDVVGSFRGDGGFGSTGK